MSTIANPTTERLIAELYKVDGKAEIVDGRIVRMSPTGGWPNRAAAAIYSCLRAVEKSAQGWAFADNTAFVVQLPHRTSFSPDAAFFKGHAPSMAFQHGAPDFAAEVRSENDYGRAPEREIAQKRAEYFAAGAKVVWDVDLQSDDVVRVYRASAPDAPKIYRRGELAEAEPAVPGWTMPVDELFE
jgi:Uma2 family endonuclease